MLGYVLAVDVLALVVLAASLRDLSIGGDDWIRFGVLALGSAIQTEAGREIERLRWTAAEGAIYANLKSMWIFAAVLVLPGPLAIAITALTFLHSGLRLRRSAPHRGIFSAASVVVGAAAASVSLTAINPTGHPGYAGGFVGLIAVIVAGVVFWFVNFALVVGAILLSNPNTNARKVLGQPSDHLVVAGALGLGVANGALLMEQPWLTVVLLITVLGLHRALLVGQFQYAARTDSQTGLANAVFWHELAGKELDRAQNGGTSLGVLYLDLDHFKLVNDTYGHLAGDQVLKVVANELKDDVRTDDLVGRLGGEEFAILLPNTSAEETSQAAERIRRRISRITATVTTAHGHATVEGLTCSIGAASYPVAGSTLDELLLAADSATYAAKNAGRNQVVTAPAMS
ncbi:GGDEF domain-containing protein [Kribbella koreensis]|uniref:GGDEF domain-containing protein n=1 Tax=Kribbella koreensis TaxID=57909 RepID=A0ABN1PNU8_9ACTN